jgi:hypothetical protein
MLSWGRVRYDAVALLALAIGARFGLEAAGG